MTVVTMGIVGNSAHPSLGGHRIGPYLVRANSSLIKINLMSRRMGAV